MDFYSIFETLLNLVRGAELILAHFDLIFIIKVEKFPSAARTQAAQLLFRQTFLFFFPPTEKKCVFKCKLLIHAPLFPPKLILAAAANIHNKDEELLRCRRRNKKHGVRNVTDVREKMKD